MHAVKRAIEERFASPPSLADLAGRFGTSEFYLLRSFKRHFAFTPFAYAQFLRTEHFLWELVGARGRREPREGRTLLALSADAGWGDYSTFERRMRAIAGRPPSELLTHDPSATLGPR
jgi:AraC-like DNA-binding protein